jgi:Protein of unknown function (DUF3617)
MHAVTRNKLLALCGIAAAAALVGAQHPSVLAQASPGVWEVSGAPGLKAPVRQCVTDVAALARFEHRAQHCSAKVTRDDGSSMVVDYSCGAGGFGRSQVELITPRSLRIETQGISQQLPFSYVLQVRRLGDCQMQPAAQHH